MTLPLYLMAHLVYGTAMAALFIRRMRVEGEVVGVPLVATLAPVAMLTAPLGAVLLRYCGGWFLHGALIGDGSVGYERFHLGLMLFVGVLAGVTTTAGMFFGIAVISRDRPQWAWAPVVLAAIVLALTLALDWRGVFTVAGTNGRLLFVHPAGLVSVAIGAVLLAAFLFARARLAEPEATGPGALIRP